MAALTTAQEYQAVREAIQALGTLDANGARRDTISFSVDGLQVSYSSAQLPWLQEREEVLANRICTRNRRKRTTASFTGGDE